MRNSYGLDSIKRIELIANKLVYNVFSGNYRSVFRGPGIEFDEFRSYMYGDDTRMIDWNVTARTGSPYVKTFREERELNLFNILDLSASVQNGSGKRGKLETEALILAILALSAALNSDRVGALFFTDRVEKWVGLAKGKKHALGLISNFLSTETIGKGSNLALALETTNRFLKKRSICVIISDFKTDDYWHEMSLLARKHDVIAIRVTDDNDLSFPDTGLVGLVEPENDSILYASGRSKNFRKAYRDYWLAHQRKWRKNCSKYGVSRLEIDTMQDIGFELYKFFQRRKRY